MTIMNSVEITAESSTKTPLDLQNSSLPEKICESNETDDVIIRTNEISKAKRVSFHFAPRKDDPIKLQTIYNTSASNSNHNRINNKTAYLKLHRHSFSGGNSTVEKLKEKYENKTCSEFDNINIESSKNSTDVQVKQNDQQSSFVVNSQSRVPFNKLEAIQNLRQKYSPKSFGYPKTKSGLPSKIPIPTPRKLLQQSKPEPVKVKIALADKPDKLEIPLITEITANNFEEVQLIYNNIEFAKPEDKHFIVTRSSSEDSVIKLENSLADFIMEKKPKEKKRSSSFRRILSGGLFGREKKKQDDKTKPQKKDNAVFSDNAQNESQVFDRFAPQRHTVDSSYPRRSLQKTNPPQQHNNSGPLYYYKPQKQYLNTVGSRIVDNRYTDMKGNQMIHNQSHQTNHPHEDYVQMDNGCHPNNLSVEKFIDTSSSSSNTDIDSRNYTYQNALIAQAELRHLRENENRKNSLQGNSSTSSSSETFRSSPPYNQKSVKNVELVKPKAIIPINSERPLPNPYHNIRDNAEQYENVASKTIERNLDVDNSKSFATKNNLYGEHLKSPINTVVVQELYGTVFDNISPSKELICDTKCKSPGTASQVSPRSLEASKLKIPSNREKVELQPRIRSPIPQTKVSTDKIIATELLRNKGSPSRSPMGSIERQHTPRSSRNTYENQPNAHSTPRPSSTEYIHINTATSYIDAKPPPSPRDNVRIKQVTLATVHTEATDTPNSIYQRNSSASPHYVHDNSAFVLTNPKPQRQRSPSYVPIQANTMEKFSIQNQIRGNSSQAYSNADDDLYVTRITYPERQSPLYNIKANNTSPLTVRNTFEDPYSTRVPLREKMCLSPNNSHAESRLPQYSQRVSYNSDTSYGTPNNTRPQTPTGQNIPLQIQKSPQKQHMFQNVEAFYWRELKKLKEKEEQDLVRYRQQQFQMYGYAEDPVQIRRSRSVSPSMQRGKRSLSLPRDGRLPTSRTGPETILEGRPMIAKRPIALPNGSDEVDYRQIRQNFERNPNFVRNTFERTTIGPIGRSRYYENEEQLKQNYNPIFKRGSLTSEGSVYNDSQSVLNKKVSFSNSNHPGNVNSWPSKNGFTQSPPTRRVEREVSLEDEVFVPNPPQVLQNRRIENVYMNDSNPTLSRSGKHEPFVQRIDPLYERSFTKHVTVSNKVCDMYGQIHDKQPHRGQINQTPHQNYGQIRQVGYVYGHLQKNPNQHTPIVMRQSFDHLNSGQPNFVRGTRLTASVNDMYHRYPVDNSHRVQFVRNPMQPPNRPLPPVPERSDSRSILAKRFIRGYQQFPDNENRIEAVEGQRILHIGAKQKNFGAFGK